MSIIPIGNQLVNTNNLPLDVRSVIINSMITEYAKLPDAYEGMLVYSKADKKVYLVTEVNSNKVITKYVPVYDENTKEIKISDTENNNSVTINENSIVVRNTQSDKIIELEIKDDFIIKNGSVIHKLSNKVDDAPTDNKSYVRQNKNWHPVILSEKTNDDGKGYAILTKDIPLSNQLSNSNTIYEIKYDFDLEENTITIPDNCSLLFNGGSIANGVIIGNNTTISGNVSVKIFDTNTTLKGTWHTKGLHPEWFGAIADGAHDCYAEIQKTIDTAFEIKQDVVFLSGTYTVTRRVAIYDGISIRGAGIYNTIIKTPWGNTAEAKQYVTNTAYKTYNTRLHPDQVPFNFTDYSTGHNRFYIGDGCVGFYDDDRATNSNHPLYWPNDGSTNWAEWNATREKIRTQGRWIGKTGREGYGGGVFISSQQPGLTFSRYQVSSGRAMHPEGIIHTGVRNVKISDLQITTNSSDRGKDSAINFKYNADVIPKAIRSTYDSSVLNIQLENLYLFSCGKTGYEATRAVDHLIKGCYIRQCAEYGINLNGVTSTTITGCYMNGCGTAGYNINGVNYSSIVACAADSCGIAYNIKNCYGITLVSCGAEATKYIAAGEDGGEDLGKGISYRITNSKGITLSSCYSFSSQIKQDLASVVEADVVKDEDDWDYIKSRHVQVIDSNDVTIQYPYFKSYCRIRTAPFRNADGIKVNVNGGTYDEFNPNSRYWQIQNCITGAQFEIRGETTTTHVVSSRGEQDLIKTSEIRINNVDIYDPGLYQNPYNVRPGYSINTAHRMISGIDGNGGWVITVPTTNEAGETVTKEVPISIDQFEAVFPINSKSLSGVRETFWKWRNSLILLRKRTDTKYIKDVTSPGVTGWFDLWCDITGKNEIDESIDWTNAIYQQIFTRCAIPIIGSDTSFIDGDKSLFTYGKLYWTDDSKEFSKNPTFCTPIPGIVSEKEEGSRVAINTNNLETIPFEVRKAAFCIKGNRLIETVDDENNTSIAHPGPVLATISQYKVNTVEENTVHIKCTTESGYNIMTLFERGEKALNFSDCPRIISRNKSDYSVINKLRNSADTATIINRLNTVIDRLVAHGFIEEEKIEETTFNFVGLTNSTDTETNITFTVNNLPDYSRIGIAYSSTNSSPTTANNAIEATASSDGVFSLNSALKYSSSGRYVRFFIDPSSGNGEETDRIYSNTYKLTYANGVANFVQV